MLIYNKIIKFKLVKFLKIKPPHPKVSIGAQGLKPFSLVKTALIKLNSKPSDSNSFEHNLCSKAGSSVATDEDDLLQELLEVSPSQENKDACTQAGDIVSCDSDKNLDDNSSNLITEINMPMKFQRFLKNFALAKADSFGLIHEKDWSVSVIGTINNFEQRCHNHQKIEPLHDPRVEFFAKTADVFANIRSELGDIAYRAKETILVESLRKPIPSKQFVSSQPIDTSEDFQSKINKRLQQIALTDNSSSKKTCNCNEVAVPSILKEEDIENIPVDSHIVTDSLPVKVTVSENHFSMNGPWLGHAFAFHSLKNLVRYGQ